MTPESIKQAREIIAAGRIDCFDNISCEELQDFAKAARTLLPQALDEIELLNCELKDCQAQTDREIKETLSHTKCFLELRAAEQERDEKARLFSIAENVIGELRQERDRLAEQNKNLLSQNENLDDAYQVFSSDILELKKTLRASAAREKVLVEALEKIRDELGVPEGLGYPAPVYNAVMIAREALERKE